MNANIEHPRPGILTGPSNLKLAPLLLALVVSPLQAQTFSLNWSTVDGGGTSTGGVYTVNATIGQPDVGKLSGGNYTLEGGFWSIVHSRPVLSVALSPGVATVSWPWPAERWVLDRAPTLSGASVAWAEVPASQYHTNAMRISVSMPIPTASQFYRLRKPAGE